MPEPAASDAMPRPRADGGRVPYALFTRADVFAREQDRIFRGPTWNYLGLEAEIPQPGDFKTSSLGDTPVVLNRGTDGALNAFVNRCAHRGATVERRACGNTRTHRCVYHQWSYNLAGDLVGVPYRRGVNGVGGYGENFDTAAHGLRKLRVESHRGVVFGTLDPALGPLAEFLDTAMVAALDRLFAKPVRVLGHMRQRIAGNWKLYAENTRDPYHAALLHMFHATFGMYRTEQKGFSAADRTNAHVTGGKYGDAFEFGEFKAVGAGQDKALSGYSLEDPSVLSGRREFEDGASVTINSIFPSLVVQQIVNTLATRHVRPRGPGEFDLYWTYFGYADDPPDLVELRLKQANLVGPAGYISMEDGEAIELIQRAIERGEAGESFVEFGGLKPPRPRGNVGETNIRGFWMHYARLMDGNDG
ncbi:MAG: Rieske 2Fe-2S domain-containing protein [Alphaproteobacteria bacterium]|nr:Rieske 2Fe-2S domain-containing protein [Alphaproteobacteria bacterium]